MTVQPIRLFGDPVLRTPAAPVTTFDAELRKLVADLTDTMHDEGGAGLAAPQLGVGLRVFTYDCDDFSGHLVNPTFDVVGDEEQLGAGGLPVDPRAQLGLPTPPARRRPRLEPARRAGRRRGQRAAWRAASSTRWTTSTGCCSSTGSTPETRKAAMAEIRAAAWFGAPEPVVKVSPHPSSGRPGSGCAWSSRARRSPPCRRCEHCSARRGTRWSPSSPAPTPPAGAAAPCAAHRSVRWPTRQACRCSPPTGRGNPSSWPRCASSLRTAARWSPTARWCRQPRSTCPRHGWVNLHFSLLPAWRGAAPGAGRAPPRRRDHRRHHLPP